MMNRDLLLSKQWRDEIKIVSEEYVESIEAGQGAISAEEVTVESSLLQILASAHSPFLNWKRANHGINIYAAGLLKTSEGLALNILALNDMVMTDGILLDPSAEDSERSDWYQRSQRIEVKIRACLNGPVSRMKSEILKAQTLIETIKPVQP